MSNGFYKNRRLKSLLFFAVCLLISTIPHIFQFKYFLLFTLTISFLVACYGLNVISKNMKRGVIAQNNEKIISDETLPALDILVAARDEENVIERLVERLFNLDYPANKLNIYIIDDGSSDKTPLILKRLSKEFDKLKIISRPANAGGGKSGALNYALKFTHGEWLLILDADAQLRNDTLPRLFNFVYEGSWSAVQLRKSVTNVSKNFLTTCQSMEMAMDAIFQYGRLSVAGVSELRGNGQLINKQVLLNCGSFNEYTVTDDLDLSLRLLISKAKIGILWDPPVMEEAVENISALFSQRQRWAEGGLQRFFDYGEQLFSKKIELIQKFDLTFFFILQYALPIISMIDLILSIALTESPSYWPISITAFTLSGIAVWYGSSCKSEGPVLQNLNLMMMLVSLLYLSHWFLVIPWVTIKMSIFPKKILWKKTLHTGI
ncbi:glycosyltransferase family 2 protein [Prochlorococcus sp. AH-716-E13]|nr:glycosyltransferase family 2 protein [Prochlorococcus sp. AH-716-E13]